MKGSKLPVTFILALFISVKSLSESEHLIADVALTTPAKWRGEGGLGRRIRDGSGKTRMRDAGRKHLDVMMLQIILRWNKTTKTSTFCIS